MSEVTATPCECGSTGALLVAIVQYGAHHPQMPHQSFVLIPRLRCCVHTPKPACIPPTEVTIPSTTHSDSHYDTAAML